MRQVGRAVLLLVLLCAVAPRTFAQQTLKAGRQLFLPAEYYVGDAVELRVAIEGTPAEELTIPDALPELPWIDIRDISVQPAGSGSEITIRFAAFMPGTRTLPPLDFGAGLLPDLKIHAASILDDTNAPFAPSRGQLLLPGTLAGLSVFVSLLFLGPILAILMAGKGRKALARMLEEHRGRRPVRLLLKRLRELEEQMGRMPGREFYLEMGTVLRSYLTGRLGRDFLSATSREFAVLCSATIDDDGLARSLSEMVSLSDRIKFGGERVRTERKLRDLSLVRDVAEHIEKRAGAV